MTNTVPIAPRSPSADGSEPPFAANNTGSGAHCIAVTAIVRDVGTTTLDRRQEMHAKLIMSDPGRSPVLAPTASTGSGARVARGPVATASSPTSVSSSPSKSDPIARESSMPVLAMQLGIVYVTRAVFRHHRRRRPMTTTRAATTTRRWRARLTCSTDASRACATAAPYVS
jgi:hypothetical protein